MDEYNNYTPDIQTINFTHNKQKYKPFSKDILRLSPFYRLSRGLKSDDYSVKKGGQITTPYYRQRATSLDAAHLLTLNIGASTLLTNIKLI